MRKHTLILMIVSSVGPLLSFAGRPACAQGVLAPWYRIAEKLDRWQLQQDQARLEQDIANGNTARANRDLEQIRRDEWWLTIDHNQRRFGPTPPLPTPVPVSAGIVPHPQDPGYGYDPSHPAQRVQLPQPVPAVNPAPGGGTSSDSAPGSTPEKPTRAKVSVVIFNPEETRVAVNYVVDGVTYRTESGGLQRLVTGPKSTIRYDKGGDFGAERYALSPGDYEFRSSATGWALVKLRRAP